MARRALKVAGTSVLVVGAAALVVSLAPTVRGQGIRQQGPQPEIRSQFSGGSEIGVRIRDVAPADVTREKLTSTSGAVIESVQAGSPAARAGLRASDVILSFDGETIRSARQLSRLIEETPDGREVTVKVSRSGAVTELKVTPEAADQSSALGGFDSPFFNLPELRQFGNPQEFRFFRGPNGSVFGGSPNLEAEPSTPVLGVEVMELNDQLGDFFGTRMGVLVTQVTDATPAKAAGVRAGDVILRVNGQLVNDTDELRRRLASSSEDVTLTVMRDKKELSLKATIEKPKTSEAAPSKRIIK